MTLVLLAPSSTLRREVRIRTLGVSLVALAAIVASLAVVRQHQQERRPGEGGMRESAAPPALDLEQLRAAGL